MFYLDATNHLTTVSVVPKGQALEPGTPVALFPVSPDTLYDAAADGRGRDTGAERIHDARSLVADDTRRLRRVGVEALPRHDFGEVEAAGPHAHSNLARARLGIGSLPNLEHFRPPMLFYPDRAHAAPKFIGPRRRESKVAGDYCG